MPRACEVPLSRMLTERDTFKAFQIKLFDVCLFKITTILVHTEGKNNRISHLKCMLTYFKVQTMLLATSSVEFLSNLRSSWDNTKLSQVMNLQFGLKKL